MDISGVSGLDSPNDARSAVIWDYDRDGWQDVAVVNANQPLLEMWRNRMGSSSVGTDGQFIALRLVGSNHTDRPVEGRSARDAYGARVRVRTGERVIMREHHCGEGLSAQNSATMLIGIGSTRRVEGLEVRWPSGKTTTEFPRIEAGTLVTVYEDPSQSPNGTAHVLEPYRQSRRSATPVAYADDPGSMVTLARRHDGPVDSRLVLYTTMAAWCSSCVRELPLLERLSSAFGPDDLTIYGVPVDESEGEEELRAWNEAHRPAYRLLWGITNDERQHVNDLLERSPAPLGLPASIVTDAEGRVLLVRLGPPTVSELRKLLEKQ